MANFTTLPSNRTLPLNSDASFECAANKDGQSLQVFWNVRRGDTIMAIITINGTLNGTNGVTVGTNGSPLTLTSVSRSLDGVTVSCVARIDIVTSVEQAEPWANLRVTSEFHYVCTMYLQPIRISWAPGYIIDTHSIMCPVHVTETVHLYNINL